MRTALPGLILLLTLLALTALCFAVAGPPAPLPASAPADQFSAERAMQHVRAIAQEPHPVGTRANAAVRDYIVAQLRALGLDPQVQRALGVFPRYGVAGMTENIVARLEGAGAAGKAILLAGHYDSAPSGPGASDDASAVATLLETARVLKAAPPLQNDVIFLFTDGEESGLLGASAFQSQHPWAAEVGLVLNFEARGHTGSSLTFQTGQGNARLIPEFARAITHPAANSLMNTVYQTLPNDTDFTVFEEAGLTGFNFGYIDGANVYHTALDDVDHLDLRSLQHDGYNALDVTRHFGNLDLATVAPGDSDVVYFDVFGRILVHYSFEAAVLLAVLLAVGYGALAAYGLRRKWLSWKGLAAGVLAFLLNTLMGLGVVWLAWQLAYSQNPQYATVRLPDIHNAAWYWWAFSALAIATTTGMYVLRRRNVRTPGLAMGALLWWVVLVLVTTFMVPGGSWILLWPAAFSLIGLAVLARRGERPGADWVAVAVLALTALPALSFTTGLAASLYSSLGFGMALGGAAVVLLLMGLLIPHLEIIARPYAWALPGIAAIVAAVTFIGGGLTASFDAAHPWPNEVVYGLDASTGKAYWIGFSDPDEWTVQYLGRQEHGTINEFYPRAQGDFPKAPAPALDLPGPEVQLLADGTQGTTRTLQLRVTSPRGAEFMYFNVVSPLTVTLGIGGYRVEGRSRLNLSAPPPEGFAVTVEVAAGSPVQILVVDRAIGLPALPGFNPSPRPASMMQAPDPDGDSTMVSRNYTFP